ncbi:unnamed protein product, partial [Brenthis ino]
MKLDAVREIMKESTINAFIVPTADAHNSQYIVPCDARVEWLSGLSGSTGTAVVTENHALVWTDARHFTQFEIEVDTEVWTLMKLGIDPSIQNWLVSNMAPNTVVGIDPTTYTRSAWSALETALNQVNVTLVADYDNVVDEARRIIGDPAPERPNEPLLALPYNYTGRNSSSKISDLLSQIRSRGASALVLSALDDIAYTLNIRGSDIPFNPVFFSYLVIRADLQQLNNNHVIWLSSDGSEAIHMAAKTNKDVRTLSTVSPVALMKCVKNSVELEGFRSSHIKDGIAVVRFLRWLHENVADGQNITEINVVDKLDELRSQEQDYKGPSFATIAGAGENGANIHYKPSREGPQRVIGKDEMLLVDSGGQYMDGTTDITRTRHMSGSPTAAQRLAFTRVLKGQILMGTAVFPRGSTGNVLDTLARKALWDVGLDYAHGTGHGVGHYLNVYEEPAGVTWRPYPHDPGLREGQILSSEPGFYKVGEYGIRHEDLVEIVNVTKDSDHPRSQYIAPSDARREWLSGLSGSSGTTVVTENHALVWTDARYFTQFEIEVDTEVWTLMRLGIDPSIQNWLVSNMAPNSVVGIDPTTYTRSAWSALETALNQVNVTLVADYDNVVDEARKNLGDPAPPRPNEPLLALPYNYTGRNSSSKISDLLSQIRSRGASALVLTALDDIAYTLNIRGSDIPFNPVFFSYLVIRADLQQLNNNHVIWLSSDGSEAIHMAAETGFRSSHIKDGIAVVRFLRWLHENVADGQNITEINVVDKLDELRSQEQDYKGPSFATIAGAGENGAIIHYKPSREGPQRVIEKDEMFLVDSGGQYMDGTTDITRTRHMSGSPTAAQRLAFTRVLKGQILMGTAVFPRGSTGNLLDILARKWLWDVGLNYAHGTGHGVGHFLNVHEGPSGIGTGLIATDPGIVPGMIFSNEPGFYEVGEYGIRHEDLVEVIEMNNEATHMSAQGMVDDFSGRGAVAFHTISLAPHQTACLDVELLNDFEITYINSYHERVLSTLGPILKQRNLTEDYEWLEKECAPIYRNAAILFKTSPFLIFGTLSLWFIKM